jgi:hypothetical protein
MVQGMTRSIFFELWKLSYHRFWGLSNNNAGLDDFFLKHANPRNYKEFRLIEDLSGLKLKAQAGHHDP